MIKVSGANALINMVVSNFGYRPADAFTVMSVDTVTHQLARSATVTLTPETRENLASAAARVTLPDHNHVVIDWTGDNAAMLAFAAGVTNTVTLIAVRGDNYREVDTATGATIGSGVIDWTDQVALELAVIVGATTPATTRADLVARLAPNQTPVEVPPRRGRIDAQALGTAARTDTGALIAALNTGDNNKRDDMVRGMVGTEETFWKARLTTALQSSTQTTAPNCAAALAAIAYLGGDGITVNIATDIALGIDPDHTLAGLLAKAIQTGMEPQAVREVITSTPTDRGTPKTVRLAG